MKTSEGEEIFFALQRYVRLFIAILNSGIDFSAMVAIVWVSMREVSEQLNAPLNNGH